MSFTKYIVPEPARMLKYLEQGVDKFYNRKIDAMMGNSVSVSMINDALRMYVEEKLSQDEIITKLKEKYNDQLGEKSSDM